MKELPVEILILKNISNKLEYLTKKVVEKNKFQIRFDLFKNSGY
jgi:hypothetical protein